MIRSYFDSRPDFAKLFMTLDGSNEEISSKIKCKYKWDDKTDQLQDRCIKNYTYYNQANPILKSIYHVKEFILSIFGQSDWDLATKRLAGYLTLVLSLNPSEGRGHSDLLAMVGFGHNQILIVANNFFRYRLGYSPDYKNLIPNQIGDQIQKNLEDPNIDTLSDLEEGDTSIDFSFSKEYGFTQESYVRTP